MNLLPMDLLSDPGNPAAGALLPEAAKGREGWHIGVRPEHVRIAEAGLPAEVVSADYLGAETMVRLACGETSLFAKTDPGHPYPPGETICIRWSREAVHLFDADGFRRGEEADPLPRPSPSP
jgi:sn-glycerol 3-phosphate transport system ATP-binding protein